jgi:hypothetical protein
MTAKVNLTTGKIVGCKENSKEWFHEKGHLEYNNSEKGIHISYWTGLAFYASVFFLIIGFKLDSLLFFAIWFWGFIYEEYWCWKYSEKHFRLYSEFMKEVKRK